MLYFLTSTFSVSHAPRIERVNQRHEMNTDASLKRFWQSVTTMRASPEMNDKELEKFAARISSQFLFMMYEELCLGGCAWRKRIAASRDERRIICMVMLPALHQKPLPRLPEKIP